MRVGTVTIGQSPREDLIPELSEVWGAGIEVLERGALDGLSRLAIEGMAPGPGDYALVTRLRDGSPVTIGKRHILPRVEEAVKELDQPGTGCILLLCTGTFPEFSTCAPLLKPDLLLHQAVPALAWGRRVGIMTPSPVQVQQARDKWAGLLQDPVVTAANPYQEAERELKTAAMALEQAGAQIIVMDCMGYTQAMKRLVRSTSGLPVILARSLVARLAAELLG
ncbi:MAG: AroM family protein [Bacillota bacterium]